MVKPLSRKSGDRGVLDRHLSMWQHLVLIIDKVEQQACQTGVIPN